MRLQFFFFRLSLTKWGALCREYAREKTPSAFCFSSIITLIAFDRLCVLTPSTISTIPCETLNKTDEEAWCPRRFTLVIQLRKGKQRRGLNLAAVLHGDLPRSDHISRFKQKINTSFPPHFIKKNCLQWRRFARPRRLSHNAIPFGALAFHLCAHLLWNFCCICNCFSVSIITNWYRRSRIALDRLSKNGWSSLWIYRILWGFGFWRFWVIHLISSRMRRY